MGRQKVVSQGILYLLYSTFANTIFSGLPKIYLHIHVLSLIEHSLIIYKYTSFLDRLLIIPVPPRSKIMNKVANAENWSQNFYKILDEVSSMIGNVIKIGQWINTPEGLAFMRECSTIITDTCGASTQASRMTKMLSCGLLVARKVILF